MSVYRFFLERARRLSDSVKPILRALIGDENDDGHRHRVTARPNIQVKVTPQVSATQDRHDLKNTVCVGRGESERERDECILYAWMDACAWASCCSYSTRESGGHVKKSTGELVKMDNVGRWPVLLLHVLHIYAYVYVCIRVVCRNSFLVTHMFLVAGVSDGCKKPYPNGIRWRWLAKVTRYTLPSHAPWPVIVRTTTPGSPHKTSRHA